MIAEIGRRDRSEKTLDQNSSNYADVLLEMHVYRWIYIPTGEEKYGGQTQVEKKIMREKTRVFLC